MGDQPFGVYQSGALLAPDRGSKNCLRKNENEEQKKVRKARARHILCMYFMFLQTTKPTGVSLFSASMDSYAKLKQMKMLLIDDDE